MAKYRCSVCGYIYDEEKEGAPFSTLSECPVCHQPASAFQLYEDVSDTGQERKPKRKLDYAKEIRLGGHGDAASHALLG